MIVINKQARSEASFKVIIGSTEKVVEGLTSADQDLWNKFIETDKEFEKVCSLDSATFLVRLDTNAEKMRKAGSKLRAELNKDVQKLTIFGGEIKDFLEGFLLSSYQFLKYFGDKEKKAYKLQEINVEEEFSQNDLDELINISKAVFWARNMVNEPVSYLTAEQLSNEIEMLANDSAISVKVLEKTQIESLKMGGLLAVNQGSIDPPTFSIIEYKHENAANKKPIVFVGKGVVYDTGGLSLKPTPNSMDVMKSDMGGAACMVGAIYLAALQKLPVHVIGLIPATDNRPGLNAYAPGDVVTMFDGTTVEVLNTDAEGRMILADALAYAKKFDPQLVIDAATLTGAAHRAIGPHASIMMGNASEMEFKRMLDAGEEMHERLVHFPFWEEYFEEMKSDIADLKNIGGPSAGMITAGKFLEHFVEAPYIHLDIAGPAWLDRQDAYRTKGGSGVGVRLLYQYLKKLN